MRSRTWLFVALTVALAAASIGSAAAAITRFTDVPDTNVFAKDIAWMDANGITSGCGADKYCPGANVTREQMAAFMHRLATKRVVDAGTLGGHASAEFAMADHDHTGEYLAIDGTATNAARVDGLSANEIVRVAGWSFDDPMTTNDYARLGSFKITAPTNGFLMLTASLQFQTDNDSAWVYCGFEIDDTFVETSGSQEWYHVHTPGFKASCDTSTLIPIEKGTYKVTVLGTYNPLLDAQFEAGSGSALFVAFDGAGRQPVPFEQLDAAGG